MLLKLYDKNNNPQDLQRIIDILNDGGLIIYPTDTMYAIGCHGFGTGFPVVLTHLLRIVRRCNNLLVVMFRQSNEEHAPVAWE